MVNSAVPGEKSRNRINRLLLLAAALVALSLLVIPTSPALAGLRKEFAAFADCPVNSPGVSTCVRSTTTGGEFKVGNKTVPVNQPIVLQGGLTENSRVLVPAADGNTLSKTHLQVPGGIIGIEVLGPLTEVNATAELAGQVEVGLGSATVPTEAVLPLKVKLENPLLGEECYVGSASEPVTPHLTTGTTQPPRGVEPITGSKGTVMVAGAGKIIILHSTSLVDNTFAVPGADGCSGALAPVVDAGVDLIVGLPSSPGTSRAILDGTLEAAGARSVKAQATLPELGRCEKVPGKREAEFNGGYVDSACIEENVKHTGQYEWVPGPGPNKKFTATSGGVTLESVDKAKVKCAASHAEGEYTATKTAAETVTLTGCKSTSPKASCQSSGAGAGEITASGLKLQLGFIKDLVQEGQLLVSIGWDLTRAPSVISAECGGLKEGLEVSGSVIAPISTIDKMTSAYTLKYSATSGKQAPEAFEEETNDTLIARIGAGSSQQAGLTAAEKITNAERLEVKGEAVE
jgi:hypothetical protein